MDEVKYTPCSKCGEPRIVGKACPPCAKAYRAAYYGTHKKEQAAYMASYRAAHRNEQASYHASYHASYQPVYRAAHKNERAAYDREYRSEHPQRTKARQAVSIAIRSGRLVVQPCENCGREPEKVNGRQVIQAHHHRGYERRFWLAVRWLCAKCHASAPPVAA